MTCIVSYKRGDTVYMAADSIGVADYHKTIRADPKLFHVGPYIIGCTTSYRMMQLLRYKLHITNQDFDDDFKHMCVTFIDEVRKMFRDNSYSKVEHSVEEGGNFLVAYKGNMYEVNGDFQVSMSADPFLATGSGYKYALSSMYETHRYLTPEEVVNRAILNAAHFCTTVSLPILMEKQTWNP